MSYRRYDRFEQKVKKYRCKRNINKAYDNVVSFYIN